MNDSKHNMPFRVPDGYFDRLQTRLSAIPSERTFPSRMEVLKPYLAMAASFALIIAGGTAVLKKTSGPRSEEMSALDMIRIADLVPATEPDMLYSGASEDSSVSDEEMAGYLIDSGTTLDYIEYCDNIKLADYEKDR